jgi:antitoxin component YwqK of YwqJK toxin-antitoxin module
MPFSRLFLLIGIVFAVAGCGGKADQQAPSTPPKAKAGSKPSPTVAGTSESGSGSTSKSDTPKAGPIEVFEQSMKAGGVVTVSKIRYEGYRLPDDKTMPHGKWQHFDPALEEEGRYEHGKRVGLWVQWYTKDGKQRHKRWERSYVAGALDGKSTKWDDKENIQEVGTYDGGSKQGVWQEYLYGLLKREETYVNNVKNGPSTHYSFANIKGQRVQTSLESGMWKKGKKFGVWTITRSDGSVISSVEYGEGGVPVRNKK